MSPRGKCYECQHSTERCKCRQSYCKEKESEKYVTVGCLPCPENSTCPTDNLKFFKLKSHVEMCHLLAQPLLALKSCDGSWHFPNEPDSRFTFWFILSQCDELILVMPECSLKSYPIGSPFRLVLELSC